MRGPPTAPGTTDPIEWPAGVRPMGDTAVVLSTTGTDEARRTAAAFGAANRPGVVDVVAGLASVVVVTDPAAADLVAVARALS